MSPDGAHLMRVGQNTIYRLPGGIVVRISRLGRSATARKELSVARWLREVGIHAVEPIEDIVQPVDINGHSVTFWQELPPYRRVRYPQLAPTLKKLHSVDDRPNFLGQLEPFSRMVERIDQAATFSAADRAWMQNHRRDLQFRFGNLSDGLPECVIHGDAHSGNAVVALDGSVILLDLEHFAIGPPEWDLSLAAFGYATCGWLSRSDYQMFCERYGLDVMESPRYLILRDLREFGKVLFAVQLAAENPQLHPQAAHRLACIRGELGPRPWEGWQPLP